MTKRISAVLCAAVLVVLAACESSPTVVNATAGAAQVEASQADSTGRVPNLFGSGN